MTKEDLFRLSCISIDATSSNLKGSIRRLVYSVFYETNNMQLTISELITKIQDRYSLEFSSKELEESLDGDKNLDRYEDGENSKFRLSIKRIRPKGFFLSVCFYEFIGSDADILWENSPSGRGRLWKNKGDHGIRRGKPRFSPIPPRGP